MAFYCGLPDLEFFFSGEEQFKDFTVGLHVLFVC